MERYYTNKNRGVIPAKAGIQPFHQCFLDSCLRRSDNTFVPLYIQTSIRYFARSMCMEWYFIRFIRLMRRWTKQIRALELFGEKNRLPRGSNLGQAGEICASGAPNDFSRSSETPNTPTHYSEEPFILGVYLCPGNPVFEGLKYRPGVTFQYHLLQSLQ